MRVHYEKIFWFKLLLIISFPLFGQSTDTSSIGLRKNAISLNFFGSTPAIGITYERVLSKRFTAEFGLGLPSVGIGAKCYPTYLKTNKVKFYFGLTTTYVNTGVLYGGYENGWEGFVIYVPVGISYFGNQGFSFGVDIGPGRAIPIYHYDGGSFLAFGNLRFGYRF